MYVCTYVYIKAMKSFLGIYGYINIYIAGIILFGTRPIEQRR